MGRDLRSIRPGASGSSVPTLLARTRDGGNSNARRFSEKGQDKSKGEPTMRRFLIAAMQVVPLLSVLCAWPLHLRAQGNLSAQGAPTPSLEDQLKQQYKLTKMGYDASGPSITDAGTVLVIQKGGILGVPPTQLTVGVSTFKDGELHSPGAGQQMFLGQITRFLQVGEKVYVLKIGVNLKNSKSDRVSMFIVECDSCNGLNQPSSYKAQVNFEYPKGYLSSADPSQVEDVINQVLTIDTGTADQQQNQESQGAGASQAPPQANAQSQPPPTIQLGQTTDEVTAILGPPDKIVNLGTKIIYVYKDLKVTFLNGKVSDVQ